MRKHRQPLVHGRIDLLPTAAIAARTALPPAVGLGLAPCAASLVLALGSCSSLAISTLAAALILSTSAAATTFGATGGSLGGTLSFLEGPSLGLGHLGLLGGYDQTLRWGLLLFLGRLGSAGGRWCWCCIGHGEQKIIIQ